MDINGDSSFAYPGATRQSDYALAVLPRNSVDPRNSQLMNRTQNNWNPAFNHPNQSSMSVAHIGSPQFQSKSMASMNGINAWDVPTVPNSKETSQTKDTNVVTKNCSKVTSKITSTHIVFLMTGLIICGIPLAVMATLWANNRVTTTTAATTVSSAGSAAASSSAASVLPIQCYTYATLNDAYRNYQNGYGCCYTPYDTASTLPGGWYRVSGAAGSQLYGSAISTTSMCGSDYPGYFNATLPSTVGGITTGGVCFYTGTPCGYSLSPITVVNCNGYYVYYLLPTVNSNYKYCTN